MSDSEDAIVWLCVQYIHSLAEVLRSALFTNTMLIKYQKQPHFVKSYYRSVQFPYACYGYLKRWIDLNYRHFCFSYRVSIYVYVLR